MKVEMGNIKDALLLKEGWRNASDKPVAALVTAGECGICLAMVNDMRYGIKLTVEEWNRVVEFVDSQLISEGLKQDNWVDWSDIPAVYNYAAVDASGYAYVYIQEPPQASNGWHEVGECTYIGHYPEVNWRQSLRKRPGA